MTLSNDIQDAIRKSLPEQTAAELKSYLEEAAINKGLLEKIGKDNEFLSRQLAYKKQECAALDSYRHKGKALEEKEIALQKLELDLKQNSQINDIRREVAAEKVQHMFEVMKIVFKSQPTGYAFSRQVTENGTEPCQTTASYAQTVSVNKTRNEYVTEKEITE